MAFASATQAADQPMQQHSGIPAHTSATQVVTDG
jgi:hypothetical protein